MAPDGQRWIACRPGFFLPVRVLSRLFRRLFLTQLRQAFDQGRLQFFNSLAALQGADAFNRYLAPVAHAEWIVYAKPPFGGPQHVLDNASPACRCVTARTAGVGRWCASNSFCRAACHGVNRLRHHERDSELSMSESLAASRAATGVASRVRANGR